MSRDLDLLTLRLLVAVDEAGSLNAGAAVVGVSQPAASARVRAFEARWQLAVLQRSARGSTLTTDGRAVIAWARSVLHGVDSMRAAMSALSEDRRAGVSIAASLTVAEFILPRWLGELHARHPEVKPRLSVVNSAAVSELVRSGAADVGFIETSSRPTDLQTQQIGSDRLIVVVHPGHPWARRRTAVSVETLMGERWVLREQGSGTRSTFERAVRREPAAAMEVSSTTALVGAARAGVGPAVVSARAVVGEVETGRLVSVPVELDLSRPLTAIWRRDERVSEPAAALLLIAAESVRRSM